MRNAELRTRHFNLPRRQSPHLPPAECTARSAVTRLSPLYFMRARCIIYWLDYVRATGKDRGVNRDAVRCISPEASPEEVWGIMGKWKQCAAGGHSTGYLLIRILELCGAPQSGAQNPRVRNLKSKNQKRTEE